MIYSKSILSSTKMRIVLYLYKIVIKITSDIPFTLDKLNE
jgi:hypothetical protein